MKLKDLIKQHITGELANLEYTLEYLLELDLTECRQQTLNELSDLFYRVSQACEDIDSFAAPTHIDLIIAQYGGEVNDWIELDGPDSSVGNDYWYKNVKTNQEVYINVDQGAVTMEVCGE